MKNKSNKSKSKKLPDERLNLSIAPTVATINSVETQQFEPGEGGDGSKPLLVEDNGNDKTAEEKLVESNPEDSIKYWKKHRRRDYNYLSLFRFASKKDKILMLVGLFASIASGICIPLMIWLFGNLVRKMVFVSLYLNSKSCRSGSCLKFYDRCDFTDLTSKAQLNATITKEFYIFTTQHAILCAIFTLLTGLYFYCWYFPAEKQIARMQLAYFEALLRKDASWSETRGDRDFANKIMENTRRIREGIGESFPMGVSLHVMYFVSLVMAFCHGWVLTLVSLGSLVILSLCSSFVTSLHARQVITEEKCYVSAREVAKEALTYISTILVHGGQTNFSAKYRQKTESIQGYVNASMYMTSFAIGLKWVMTMWVFALVLWYGLGCILRDLSCSNQELFYNVFYDAGDLIVIFCSVFFVMVNDGPMFPFYLSLKIATICGRDVFWIIDTKSDIDSMGTSGFNAGALSAEPISGKIDFEDVRFTYPSGTGKSNNPVLNGSTLSIAPGTKVGIVGVPGCGKSTLLSLILKEYSVDSGFVKIDGVDIKSVNTHWIRSHIGLVSQDPGLFDDTIEQNVRMGKLNSSFFEIQDACKKANAHDFIVALKDGYQSKIGVDGNRLTAGQRQRLAIARALIRNPKILLLDEPTTALDSYSEFVVMQTLEKVAKHMTVIIVAHRLQTVVNADIIYVLRRGKVVEKGNHLTLLKNKGPYSQLASSLFHWESENRIKSRFASEIEPFDVSERNATNYLKSFNVVPLLTNRYNNLLALDPVTERTTKRFIIQREANLKHVFRGRDEFFYSLTSEKKKMPALSESITKIEYPTMEQLQKDIERQEELIETYVHTTSSEDEFESITYTYWKILIFVSKNVILIGIGTIFSCIMGLATPVYGVLFAGVFSRLCHPEHWSNWDTSHWEFIHNLGIDSHANYWFIGFLLLGIVLAVASILQNIMLTLAGYKIVTRLRNKLFSWILQQDASFFEDPQNSISELTNIMDHNAGSMRFIVTSFYGTFIQCMVTVIASIVYCCSYNGKLTGYVIAMFPVIIGFPLCESWLGKRHEKKVANDIEQMSGLILEVFSKRLSVSSLQLEPYFIDRLNQIQKQVHRSKNRYIVVRVISFGFSQSACFWAYTLFMFLGGREIVEKEIAFEDVIAIGEILIFGLISLGMNLSVITSFDLAVTAGEKIASLLQREPGLRNGGGEIVTSCTGQLSMRDVHFWYPYSSDVPQLRDISLKIEPGSLVAIVGSSESGKSAYLSILLRLYDPIGGTISLDGVDIKALNVPSYRSNFGLVDSVPQLFNATVAENIAYGDNTRIVTMKDVIEAAKKANVHHLIVSLPNGYDTNIGTAEENALTMGQKQRICFARALLRDPSIIIFHEAVSHLDRESEKTLIESLEEARKNLNLTCIIIEQRLFSVQNADLICFMYDGEIVEKGTHKDLMQSRGKYFDMWKQQNPLADSNFRRGKMPYNDDNPRRHSETIVVSKDKRKNKTSFHDLEEHQETGQLPDPQSNSDKPITQIPLKTQKAEGQPQSSWGVCNIFGE